MATTKNKRIRLWLIQTNLSGNANGHFELIELPITSKKNDVIKEIHWWCFKVLTIKDLGIFISKIGDRDFPTASLLKKYKYLQTP